MRAGRALRELTSRQMPRFGSGKERYYEVMAKALIEVACPCCQAVLKIDPEIRAIISHKVPEKPPVIEDLAAAVAKLKGEAGRRDEVFRKSFEAEKGMGKLLDRKFDELLKQAKENPGTVPPKRDIDLD